MVAKLRQGGRSLGEVSGVGENSREPFEDGRYLTCEMSFQKQKTLFFLVVVVTAALECKLMLLLASDSLCFGSLARQLVGSL